MSLRRTAFATSLLLALSVAHAQTSPTRPLNDTGITWSGHATSGNAATCDPAYPAGQDCHYGRDAAAAAGDLTKIGAGAAGFDFTKISNSGNPLPASATLGTGPDDWACTRDNVTGLVWEVKLNDVAHLRHMGHTYTWYDTDAATNGGADGSIGSNTCNSTLAAAPYNNQCNTQHYVAAINALSGAERLCGATDWRMPTVKELEGIVDFGRVNPAIDPDYFPNTPSSVVWSGSPYADSSNLAWYVVFSSGFAGNGYRSSKYHVRLVRGGQ